MFHTALHTLNLRSLPTFHMPLDRILHILKENKDTLKYLSIHFQGVTPAIIPLNSVTLPELVEFSIGGHHALSQLVDSLILPSLEELNLDIEAREPIEDVIMSLIARSGGAAAMSIKHLSVAYGFGCGRRASKAKSKSPPAVVTKTPVGPSGMHMGGQSFYYGPGGVVIGWNILNELSQLESLRVGGTPMDTLLCALSVPDDDIIIHHSSAPPGQPNAISWLCPNLRELGMKNCHAHSEAAAKLVQMIEARNPDANATGVVINGVAPKKLRALELYECSNLGQDVVQWLQAKVEEVIFTEPPYAYER